MIARLSAVLFLCLLAVAAPAAELVTVTVTITNNPVGNTNSITINSSTRTWTNTVTGSPGTLIQQTNTTALATTNLLNHLTSYRVQAWHLLSQGNDTNLTIRGRVGEVMTVTIAGGWASVTYATNTVTSPTFSVRVPITVEAATNQTNIASMLVTALERATNSLSTNNTGLANYVTKGASALQEVIAPALFSGGLRGSNVRLTNGFTLALTNINSVSSNHINYGNAIRSEGSGGNSLQVGSNALAVGSLSIAIGNGAVASNTTAFAVGIAAKATNSYAMAVGNDSISGGTDSLAVGRGAQAYGSGAQAIGQGAYAQGDNSLAIQAEVTGSGSISIGAGSGVSATNATALGTGSTVTHNDSTAIGKNATSTTTNQIRLGTSSDTVSIPGQLVSASVSNTTYAGSSIVSGDMSFVQRANSSVANGHNTIDVGTNVYIRLTGTATADWQFGAISGGNRDGKILILQNATGYGATFVSESGTEPTVGNRILTYTRTNIYWPSNGIAQLIYDTTASRWQLFGNSIAGPRTVLTGSTNFDFGSISVLNTALIMIPVIGALTNDVPKVSFPPQVFTAGTLCTNIAVWTWATNDLVGVRFINTSTNAACNPAVGTFSAVIERY